MTTNAFNEIRERVYSNARDSSRDFITEPEMDLWITEAIEDLSSRVNLNQESKTGTTSGSTIAIPTDYVDLISLKVVKEGESNDYVDFVNNSVFNSYQEESADLDYTLGRVFNGDFELYPTPDTGSAYTIRYWSSSASLAGFSATLRTRIVNYATSKAKEKADDFRAAEWFLGLYERGLPAPRTLSANAPILQDITISAGPFDVADAKHN